MAKSKRTSTATPATVVPLAELVDASTESLLQRYTQEQLWDAVRALLDGPDCAQSASLFERAVAWQTPASASQRVAWVNRYANAHRGVPDAVPWWDVCSREWLLHWARLAPEELREHRQSLAPQLGKLADFCLAVTAGAAMPPDVAGAVAKHFLNAPSGGFAYDAFFSRAQIAAFAESALCQAPFPVLRRERVLELSAGASVEAKLGLAVNYCGSDFRRVGCELLLGADCTIPPGAIDSWAARVTSPEGRIVLSLVYAHTHGGVLAALPSWAEQALLLDLRSGSLDDVDVTRAALLALPTTLARSLLAQALREERATLLIPSLADEALLHEFLARVEAGDVGRETAVEALAHCGAGGLSALLSFEGCNKSPSKISANLGVVVAEALLRLLPRVDDANQRHRAALVLVPWLGHTSKAVVASTKRALECLGQAAAAPLADGARTGKKQARQEAERLLERLTHRQAASRTPLDEVSERARRVPETREAFQRLCQDVVLQSETWEVSVRPVVEQHGSLCLEWLRPWFEEHVPQGDVRLWCYVVDLLATDSEAVWVAVDTFARMPKLPTSLWARPRGALAKLGDKLAAPAKHVLMHGQTHYAEPIYGMLAAYAREEATDLLLAGLSSESKAIRSHSVDGLSRLPNAPLAPVLERLEGSNPGVRISAAELLAVWGRREATSALEVAFANETRAPVRAYLEEALAATSEHPLWGLTGGGHTSSQADASNPESTLEAALASRGQGVQAPRFLLDHPLPPLSFRSGRPLSDEAALGFLSLVTNLDATLKGRLVRHVSALLDPEALAGWSRHLHDRWNRSKDTRFKYAVYQVWLLGDEALIHEVGEALGRLRASEHVVVACYLRVLHWRASRPALDWLVHWAAALPSRGARTLAQTLPERVAYRTGMSVGQLRQAANRWVYHQTYERRLAHKTELERFDTERFVQYLEDCLISGRRWAWDEWVALHDRFPDLFKRLIWRVTVEPSARVFETALARRGLFQSGCGESIEGDSATEISLAHPIGGTKAAWERVRTWLGERANDPPLRQWDRPVFTCGADDDLLVSGLFTDSERLDRWMKRRGWFHGEPLDHGLVYSNSKVLGARGLVFQLSHSGYPIGQHEFAERVRIQSVEVTDLDGGAVALSDVDPIVYSEMCYQLSELASED